MRKFTLRYSRDVITLDKMVWIYDPSDIQFLTVQIRGKVDESWVELRAQAIEKLRHKLEPVPEPEIVEIE